jgi:hypothetical protein
MPGVQRHASRGTAAGAAQGSPPWRRRSGPELGGHMDRLELIRELTAALRQAAHLLETAPLQTYDREFGKEAAREFRSLIAKAERA